MTIPRYGKTSRMKLWRKTTRRSEAFGPEERRADRLRQAEADGPADERAEEVGDLRRAQPGLDEDDEDAEDDADADVDAERRVERTRQGRGPRDGRYEQRASDEMPGHGYDSGYENPSSYP